MKKESYSYVMMLGHMCADLSAFALMAMLPFLVVHKGLSYTSAAGLSFTVSICNAIVQPICGAIADKKDRPWMMAVGVFLSGCGIATIGLLNNYWAMILAVVISSVGLAIYHPDGGKMANYVSGQLKGKGMSNFSFGGNISGAVGPALAVFGITCFGMPGTLILAVPAVAMAIYLLALNGKFMQFAGEGKQEMAQALKEGRHDDWPSFLKLSGVTVLRSAAMVGMNTFIPLFWLSVLMQSETVSGMVTTVIAISGGLATLVGGRLADRYGFNKVIRIGLCAFVPLLALIAYLRSPALSLLALIPAAVALNMAYGPSVVLGQKFLPNHLALASGITMGLASSIGGIASPILGKIADKNGVGLVLWMMVAIAFLAAVASFSVPDENAARRKNKQKRKA